MNELPPHLSLGKAAGGRRRCRKTAKFKDLTAKDAKSAKEIQGELNRDGTTGTTEETTKKQEDETADKRG